MNKQRKNKEQERAQWHKLVDITQAPSYNYNNILKDYPSLKRLTYNIKRSELIKKFKAENNENNRPND